MIIEARRLGYTYPASGPRRRSPFRVTDLTFGLEAGEILGVIGPNSAGKTTLIRLLTRVLEPNAGDVLLEGRPLRDLDRTEVARRVAVVPQGMPPEFPFTVEELVLMGRFPHAPSRYFEDTSDRAVARDAMAAVGVLDLATHPLDTLSGGERQRAVIARALAQQPRLLVLDEPTAHFDLRHQAEAAGLLRGLNRERQVSILLVSHDLNFAGEVCDRLLLLADGRLVRGGAPEDVLDASVLEAVYGCEVHVEKSSVTRRPMVQVVWPEAQGQRGRAAGVSPEARARGDDQEGEGCDESRGR